MLFGLDFDDLPWPPGYDQRYTIGFINGKTFVGYPDICAIFCQT